MSYTLSTLNQQRHRVLSEDELKSILSVALKNGWQPLPHRVRNNQLDMKGKIDEVEALEMAAALERGLKRHSATLPPPLLVAIMETIGVLRHSAASLTKDA
jgi:hypothetical protein